MADKTLTCKDCGKEFVSLKENKNSTKKKDSKTNHKDAQNAEEQENKKETTIEDSEDNRIMKKWLLNYFNSFLY